MLISEIKKRPFVPNVNSHKIGKTRMLKGRGFCFCFEIEIEISVMFYNQNGITFKYKFVKFQ